MPRVGQRQAGAGGGGGGAFESENVLVDAATAPGSGVALRAPGAIIGIAGDPVAGSVLSLYTAAGRTAYFRENQGTGLLTLSDGTLDFLQVGEVAFGVTGVRAPLATPFALYTTGAERMRIAAGAAEFGFGVQPVADSPMSLLVGASSHEGARAGGRIFIDTDAVGTDADMLEKDLIAFTLPANALDADGKGVRITAWGVFAGNANNKTPRLRFGGTAIAGAGGGFNGSTWRIQGQVFRTGAATQDAISTLAIGGVSADSQVFTTPTDTLSASLVIRVTGQNGVSAANDIICEGMSVEYLN